MRISFKRSGGFAGLVGQNQGIEIDTEKLPQPKAKELEKLVKETRAFDHQSDDTTAYQARDGYQYDLTLDEGERKHSIQTSDGAVPDKLQPLIQWLSKEVNEELKKKKGKTAS